MSDALSDFVKTERERIEYLSAVNTIAEYIAKRAINRPPEIREKYLRMAYDEIDKVIQATTNELLEEVTRK